MDFITISSWSISIGLIIYTLYTVIYFIKKIKSNDIDVFDEQEPPSRIASLGVLGTFFGITISLLYFDSSNIENSVPYLLDGMRTAFITSITGMLGSIIMKGYQSYKRQEKIKSEQSTISSIDENATIATLIEYLQNKNTETTKFNNQLLSTLQLMNKSISDENDTTLLSQLKNLRLDITDEQKNTRTELKEMRSELVQSFNKFAEQMAENNSKAFIKALEETIKDFNTKIQEQFGENFKQLNLAVGKLLTWQEEYKNTIIEVTENQKLIFSGIEQAKLSLNEMANNSHSIKESAQLLSNIILTAERYQEELYTSLNTLVDICNEAKQLVPSIDEMINKTTERIAELHNETQENISTNSDKIVSLTTKASDSIDEYLGHVVNNLEHHDEILHQSFEKTNQTIENTTFNLEEKVISFNQNLNSTLEKTNLAFKNSLEKLNNTTNSEIEKQINTIQENIKHLSISTIEKLDNEVKTMFTRLNDISNTMLQMLNAHENELNNAFDKTNKSISAATDKLERSALEVTNTISDRLVEMNKQNNDALHKTTENMHKNLENVMGEAMKQFANQLALISNKFAEDYTPLAEKLREVVQISRRLS